MLESERLMDNLETRVCSLYSILNSKTGMADFIFEKNRSDYMNIYIELGKIIDRVRPYLKESGRVVRHYNGFDCYSQP